MKSCRQALGIRERDVDGFRQKDKARWLGIRARDMDGFRQKDKADGTHPRQSLSCPLDETRPHQVRFGTKTRLHEIL